MKTMNRALKKSAKANPPRILIAKVGLDGHDRGIKIVARALRDAGIEVIYLGLHNTPEEIVLSAIQEDVEAIGLSVHSAAHLRLFQEVLGLLKKHKARDITVFGGGIIPGEDIKRLTALGVRALFGPGTPVEEIVRFVTGIKPAADHPWRNPLLRRTDKDTGGCHWLKPDIPI